MIDWANHKASNSTFILEELKKGNERALEFIFNEFYKTLVQFSYSIVKDQASSEGIVQEVLIKLWERRESLGDISNLLSYLMVMTRNHSIDFLRRKKMNSQAYSNLRIIETADTTDEHVAMHEFEEQLLKSIMKLPNRCREAIEKSRFEGLSNKEIAQQMEISEKGVEALIGRSLKLLRKDLQEFLPSLSGEKPVNKIKVLFSILLLKKRTISICP